MNNKPIDIVISWVDGNDREWVREKDKYLSDKTDLGANSSIRYEDWGNLHILFRGIEKFMPWANKIFLVTCGHFPNYLDLANPRLRLVSHEEYIPGEYLPTFNSNTIEMNYFRIGELSENFILFNDDMFPLLPIDEEYYFVNDEVCEEAVEMPIMPLDIGDGTEAFLTMMLNNVRFINRHFNKRKVQKENNEKWFFEGYGDLLQRTEGLRYWNNFVGFHDRHMPVALKKSTFAKIWETEPEALDAASRNRFRDYNDLTQYLARYWQICEGDFHPRRTLGEPYAVTIENYREVARAIREEEHQMVCLLDRCSPEEFEIIKPEINAALESVLPDKCSFER